LFVASIAAFAETSILNASYDVSRELYKDIDPAFVAAWKKSSGTDVEVKQSHGGSTKQAQAVAEGLEADVVTLNQPIDLDFLVKKGVISSDWRKKFPNAAAPYTTTSIFLVRKGNPKGIKDWDDLVKSGVSVVIPNPKTSGNGRYTYLAAWGYAKEKLGSDDKARDFVAKLFTNVPVFDDGGRGATTTFTQRAIGDVLVTFENEAALIKAEVDGENFDVVYPSLSVEAAPPVAIVNSVTQKHGTAQLAKAYLDFLYSDEAQKIIAKHHFRPRSETVLKEAHLPEIRTFRVESKLGPWAEIQKTHFADGGIYDQITAKQN
jgi:sulfate transport system substrate-binding protein